MLDTPAAWNAAHRPEARYPGVEGMARYSFHTGAPLRRLGMEERCPVLFRDLGPAATASFLRGELSRLAGPLSPITYLRTEGWAEPYVDHGAIGRVVALRPLALGVWHSGVEHIYVARATRGFDPRLLGYVPGHVALERAAELAAEVPDRATWREQLGGVEHDDAVEDALVRLAALDAELRAAEVWGAPLRGCLKVQEPAVHLNARSVMARAGLTEHDLCAAWHHLPAPRRAAIQAALEAHREEIAALVEATPAAWRARFQLTVR